MDRLSRVSAGGCLVLVLGTVVAASGCRSMRNEVPPGKPYSTTGGGPPHSPVRTAFNSDPHPSTSMGMYRQRNELRHAGAIPPRARAVHPHPASLALQPPMPGPIWGPAGNAYARGGAGRHQPVITNLVLTTARRSCDRLVARPRGRIATRLGVTTATAT